MKDASAKSSFSKRMRFNVLVLGQGKGHLLVDSLFGSRVANKWSFFLEQTFSPFDADILIVTGGLGLEAQELVLRTYYQMPPIKKVILFGTAALNGGVFDHLSGGKTYDVWKKIQPDGFIPGEPPDFLALLDGLEKVILSEEFLNA